MPNETASVTLPAAESCALRVASAETSVLRAIHAERASSNAIVASPHAAAITISSASETQPRQTAAASNAISAARIRSTATMTAFAESRSTSTPSSKAPTAPAATSATASSPISSGVAPSDSVAIHGITSRVSIDPKFETTSATRTRRNCGIGADAADGASRAGTARSLVFEAAGTDRRRASLPREAEALQVAGSTPAQFGVSTDTP